MAYLPINNQIIEREPVHSPVPVKKLRNQILVEKNKYKSNLRMGEEVESNLLSILNEGKA